MESRSIARNPTCRYIQISLSLTPPAHRLIFFVQDRGIWMRISTFNNHKQATKQLQAINQPINEWMNKESNHYSYISSHNLTLHPVHSKLQQFLLRFWKLLLHQGLSWMICSFNCMYRQGAVGCRHFHHLADRWFCWSLLTWTCNTMVIRMHQQVLFNWMLPAPNAPCENLLELRLATCRFIQFPMLWKHGGDTGGNFFVAAHDIWFSTSVTASWHHNTITGLLENQLGDDASNIGLAKCNEKHNNSPSWSKGLPTLIKQLLVRTSEVTQFCP